MEVVVLRGRQRDRRCRRRRDRRATRSQTGRGAGPGHRIVAPGDLRRTCAALQAGVISFRQARGFTLDEYVGLPADHPQRYRNVIDTVFVSRVDFAPGAVQGPDGLRRRHRGGVRRIRGGDPRGGRYRPADPRHRHRRAHRVQRARVLAGVTDQDQDADQADPDGQRPLLRRRRRRGADALPDAGAGDHHGGPAPDPGGDRSAARQRPCTNWSRVAVSAMWPATILQHHPHVTVLLDEAAARRLQLVDYYRETYRSKPDWQGI